MTNKLTGRPSSPFTFFLFITLVLSCNIVLFSQDVTFAETRYVKPSSEVVVRRGQGTDYKIVAMVKDGASVEFIAEDGDYVRVGLANGKEGWMLKRFLSNEPPLKEIVAGLRREKDLIQQRETEAVQKLTEVSSALKKMRTELTSIRTERDRINESYNSLRQDNANVVQIKSQLQDTAKENKSLTKELAFLKQENKKLKKDFGINWFLAGAGVLILGIITGKITSKSRKKRSSLL